MINESNTFSILTIKLPDSHGNTIKYVNFLKNNRLAISTIIGYTAIMEYDIQNKQFEMVKEIDSRGGFLMDASLSPDETLLFTAHGDNGGHSHNIIKCWDLESGKCINEINGHGFPIWKVESLSNAKQLIYTSGPSAIVWDIASNSCATVFNKHRKSILCFDVSLKNNSVYSACKEKLCCWRLSDGTELLSKNIKSLSQLKVLENGILATIWSDRDDSNHLQLLDTIDLHLRKSFDMDKSSGFLMCKSTLEHNYLLRFNNSTLTLFDLETLSPLVNISHPGILPTCFAILDKKLAAISDGSGKHNTVHIYPMNQVPI